MNKEARVNMKAAIEAYPIPCDFDGKNILLMNNFVDAKNNLKQKLTIINLETRETVNIRQNISKMKMGVFGYNGIVMVQEQSEVIYMNFLGRNLRVLNGRDDKGFFSADIAVKLIMDDLSDEDEQKSQAHGKIFGI